MKSQLDIIPVDIEGAEYLVDAHLFGNLNSKNELILSPGFSVPWKYFEKLSHLIIQEIPDFLIVVPEIIGKKIKSDSGEVYKNNTHEASKKIYSAFVRTFNAVIAEATLSDFYTAGQSSGPVDVQSVKLILINPMMPVKYNRNGFLRRGMVNNFFRDMQFCMGTSYGMDYAKEFMANLGNNLSTIKDLTDLTLNDIYPEKSNTDLLLMCGVNEDKKDQFFDYKGVEDKLSHRFRTYQEKFIQPGSHHSILYNPEAFVKTIKEFILS